PAFRAGIEPLEMLERRNRDAQSGPSAKPMRCVIEDTTLQALALVLAENPRGLLLARDELAGWVLSFDQFTGANGADLSRWLEIYRAGPLRVDRVTTGHQYVRRAAVSICGTIQTDRLPAVFHAGHQAAGLLARFLMAAPPETPRRWESLRSARAPDRAALLERFERLHALDLAADGASPRALGLSSEAANSYGEFFTEHERLRQDTEPGPWRAALGKLEEVPGRLALVLALGRAEEPGEVEAVDGDTMRRAIELTEWCRTESERLYGMFSDTPADRRERQLVEWICARPEGATARDVVRGHGRYRGPAGTPKVTADLARLVREGRLSAEEHPPTSRGGRPTTVYCRPRGSDTTPDGDPLGNVVLGGSDSSDSDTTPKTTPNGEVVSLSLPSLPPSNTLREGSVTSSDETPWEVNV
ncbi:MAG: DUF3987 domain-containing protein, partial [Acidobacteriota bacterium]